MEFLWLTLARTLCWLCDRNLDLSAKLIQAENYCKRRAGISKLRYRRYKK